MGNSKGDAALFDVRGEGGGFEVPLLRVRPQVSHDLDEEVGVVDEGAIVRSPGCNGPA